ncbi:MAG: BamA/TamA family outer membrane protein [Ignavibacteriae bacterium]|nr:BamA/TamA family outer membrane protein [Ignavibacteriota bacterium]
MRVIVLICFLIVCSSILVASGRSIVRSITINGNHVLSQQQLVDAMSSKLSKPFSIEYLTRDLESLRQQYHSQGYYFAEVQIGSIRYSSDSELVDIVLDVHEGDPTDIGKITIRGNTALTSDEILKHFETHVGGFVEPNVLEGDIDRLISTYEGLGYPFAAVAIQNISLLEQARLNSESVGGQASPQQLLVELSINEGSKVEINEIRVVGNKATKEKVILREIRMTLPETFNQQKVDKIASRLNRLNIFSHVREPELYMNSRGGGLLITVEEGNTNTFDGVVGYVPGLGQGGEGTITGLVNVSMRNLFGTARKFHVRWQRDDRHSQEIGVQYVEPWVLSYPVNLSGSFFQRQQDTTYVKRSYEFRADLLVTESFSMGGVFSHENIIPSSQTITQSVFNSRTITLGVEIQYDTRNDVLSPTSGVHYRSDYRYGNKNIYSSSSRINVQRTGVDVDVFVQPIQRQVVALGLHGRQIISSKIELGDLYRFGGTNTLRGYRENQFLGSRIAWTDVEYRFLLARRSFFYGFFDTGYYFFPSDDAKGIPSTQRLKYGYGVGIRLETALGNLGVSFALGEGDPFSQAKLHFGLINEF